jgi:hypothetical protein
MLFYYKFNVFFLYNLTFVMLELGYLPEAFIR